MDHKTIKTLLAGAVLAMLATPASAMPITDIFDITASGFSYVGNTDGSYTTPIPAVPQNSGLAEISVTFDPTQSTFDPTSPIMGWTQNGIKVLSTTMPNSVPLWFDYTSIASNYGNIALYGFEGGGTSTNLSADSFGVEFNLLMTGPNADPYSSQSTSSTNVFYVDGGDNKFEAGNAYVGARVAATTSAVPLPKSAVLFLTALAGLALMAFKRRQAVQ